MVETLSRPLSKQDSSRYFSNYTFTNENMRPLGLLLH